MPVAVQTKRMLSPPNPDCKPLAVHWQFGIPILLVFGRFSAKLGPKTPLERQGSSCSAGCTKNQPRRPFLRQFRDNSGFGNHPPHEPLRTDLSGLARFSDCTARQPSSSVGCTSRAWSRLHRTILRPRARPSRVSEHRQSFACNAKSVCALTSAIRVPITKSCTERGPKD